MITTPITSSHQTPPLKSSMYKMIRSNIRLRCVEIGKCMDPVTMEPSVDTLTDVRNSRKKSILTNSTELENVSSTMSRTIVLMEQDAISFMK